MNPAVSHHVACPIDGCRTRGGADWVRLIHVHQEHVRCHCGWVGVGFFQHRGQAQRYTLRHNLDVEHYIVVRGLEAGVA